MRVQGVQVQGQMQKVYSVLFLKFIVYTVYTVIVESYVTSLTKVLMQGKLIAVVYCVHIETSSLWAEFVDKNRCISVRLVSEEHTSIQF